MTRTAHTDVAHEEKCLESSSRIQHSVAVEPASPPLVKTLTIAVPGLPPPWDPAGGGWGQSSRKEKDIGEESLRGEKEGR